MGNEKSSSFGESKNLFIWLNGDGTRFPYKVECPFLHAPLDGTGEVKPAGPFSDWLKAQG